MSADPSCEWTPIAKSCDLEGEGNFPQGCSFSPDGLCVLTSTAGDSKLRLYNTCTNDEKDKGKETKESRVGEWKTALSSTGGDTVRCYHWYPGMKSSEPSTCCYLAACRELPAQLFDAYTGALRATYSAINALDEMESPTVVRFTPDCQRIATAGFRTDRTIHVFQTDRPGRESTVLHLGKTRRSSDGQKGLVSALAYAPDESFLCVGTYSPGSIYLYDERSGQQPNHTILTGMAVVGHGKSHANKKRRLLSDADSNDENLDSILSAAKRKWFQTRAQGGVTQLQFAPNKQYILHSASRRSDAIISWDLRMLSDQSEYATNPVQGLGSFETRNETNQRLEFDFDDTGETLFVGGQDNCVRIYDVASGKLREKQIRDLDDAANGVSFCGLNDSQSYLCVATGSRRFPSEDDLQEQDPEYLNRPPGHLYLYAISK